jgi:SAM-dependent methyltransferase
MNGEQPNRFQDFFEEDNYVTLKNHLYNYRLRKRAVEKVLSQEAHELILEVGSGISPVMTRADLIVYSEISFLACSTLKRLHGRGWYVVADATHLPFRSDSFSHAISSEVLEHIVDDFSAVSEMSRVLKRNGRAIVTFPHRKLYFTNDDRYVGHYRRYEKMDMEDLLRRVGLRPFYSRCVLGLMEKVTLMSIVWYLEMFHVHSDAEENPKPSAFLHKIAPIFNVFNLLYATLLRFEAFVTPQRYAAVLLIEAEKQKDNEVKPD